MVGLAEYCVFNGEHSHQSRDQETPASRANRVSARFAPNSQEF